MTIDAQSMADQLSACGVDILAALASHSATDAPLTSSRIATLTDRDRGIVARVVEDLCELGLIERSAEDRGLRLGWGLYAAAAQVVEQRVVSRGQLLVQRVAAQSGESSYLVRRRGALSLTVAEAMPGVAVRGVSWLGRSQPVSRGDAGPVLLMDLSRAELRGLLGGGPLPPSTGVNAPRTIEDLEREISKVRVDGVCVLMDHVEAGVASVGAPVLDFRRRLVGAIVVVGPSTRISPSLSAVINVVRDAARDLSAALGADIVVEGVSP